VHGRSTAWALKSFSHHDNLFAETGRKASRSSAIDDAINRSIDQRRCHRRI